MLLQDLETSFSMFLPIKYAQQIFDMNLSSTFLLLEWLHKIKPFRKSLFSGTKFVILNTMNKYCYGNGNGVLKIINQSFKNKSIAIDYMINE